MEKASALADKKVSEVTAFEEQISRLAAEKAKADQKYFGAMKAKEAKDGEIRILRAQNAKSSEIVMQLKEAEASSRTLTINLEKQLAETREALNNVTSQLRELQQKANEHTITSEGQIAQLSELKKALSAKDASCHEASKAQRQAAVEVEALKVRLEETQKSLENWKQKGVGNQTGEYDALRVSLWATSPYGCGQKLIRTRVSQSAPYAVRTSKTRRSRRAATSFVGSASMSVSRLVRESAQTAAKPSDRMIICG